MQNDFLHNKKLLKITKIEKTIPIKQKILKTTNVDINRLLNRVKIEKNNKRNENLVLSGVMISIILLIAIISF
jgi:hypothetical protein